MGFEFESRTARVTFDESTSYAGVEVVFNLNVPMDTLLRFMEYGEHIRETDEEGNSRVKASEMREMFSDFGDRALVEWNLTNGGEPIPANGEGLIHQPGGFAFAAELLSQFNRASTGDDAPLETASTSSAPSVVRLAQTEAS